MGAIELRTANKIIELAVEIARKNDFSPLTFCILDPGGHIVSAQREDGSGILRFEIAMGKAWGSLGMGHGSRWLHEDLAVRFPRFVDSLVVAAQGRLIPMLGGVLIRGADRTVLGAMGVTGEKAANDEMVAVQSIEGCGLIADVG